MPGIGGMSEPGFFPDQAGYNNHQNFGNNMHQPFRNDRGFGRPYGRGYGRGRGFNGYNRGRGGFGFQQQQNFGHNQGFMQNGAQQQAPQAQQGQGNPNAELSNEPAAERGSPSYEPMNTKDDSAKDANLSSRQVPGEPTAKQGTNGTDDSTTNTADTDGMQLDHETETSKGATTESGKVSGKHECLSIQQLPALDAETLTKGSAATAAVDSSGGNGEVGVIPSYTGDNMVVEQSGYPLGPNGMGPQDGQPYNGVYQQFGYGPRGGGGFRGRGGYGGRGGFGYGAFTEAKELTGSPAPPINAPTGPKAMREGKPNTGFNPKLAQMQAQAQAPPAAPVGPAASQSGDVRAKRSDRNERDRSYSRSRSRSKHRSSKRHHRSDSEDSESDESRQRRKDRERRRRKDRDRRAADDYFDGDDAGRKVRSREESGVDDSASSRRRRDKDEEHRSSRSHRDRSRERDRHRRRHRSRSPAKDGSVNGDADSKGRRKSRRDRKYDDDDDQENDTRDSRRQSHRNDQDRLSNREKTRAVLEQPSDDIGFKIKGSKSASINPAGMGPPRHSSPNTRRQSDASIPNATADPYAAEREKRHAERVLKEQQRRHGSSLGKRASRDEDDEIDAPRGPKGDAGAGGRKKRERKVSVRYEGEVDEGFQERESGRWR
nr:hypothetical protein CFP56_24373 [Quercus suber]